MKSHCQRQGKTKIDSWEKLKKHLCSAFLPFNYTRELAQRTQRLSQDGIPIDDYTEELYQLASRSARKESDEEMVTQFIGGLDQYYQDTLSLFNHWNVSEAHQRALSLERQESRRNGRHTVPFENWASPFPPILSASQQQRSNQPKAKGELKCDKCGDAGHFANECKKVARPETVRPGGTGGKNLFIEDVGESHVPEITGQPIFYKEECETKELSGDVRPLLLLGGSWYDCGGVDFSYTKRSMVVQRVFFTPKEEEN